MNNLMDPCLLSGHAPSRQVNAVRCTTGVSAPVLETVAEETPVGLEYNGVPHVVMLATPADLGDFALGFSLTEGILKHPDELRDLEVCEFSGGLQVKMTIDATRFETLDLRRKNLAGRTGCGLCGAEHLAQVFRPMIDVTSSHRLPVSALEQALRDLGHHQPLQQATGATHAAFWLDEQHRITLSREDVGRHNALDKLVGALARQGTDFSAGALLVTSRASYEMVQKSIQMGIGLLLAISAPTALAIHMADQFNLTLAGFTRQGRHVVYTHPERFVLSGECPS